MQDGTVFLDCDDIIQTFHADLSSYQEIPTRAFQRPVSFQKPNPRSSSGEAMYKLYSAAETKGQCPEKNGYKRRSMSIIRECSMNVFDLNANNNKYVIRYSGLSTESTSSSFRASCSQYRFCWCSFGALALCPSKLLGTCSSCSCGNSRLRHHSNNSFRFRPNKFSSLLLDLFVPILVRGCLP